MASFKILQGRIGLGLAAVSVRFLREIPIFAKYFIYYRVISWSPDGRHIYMQAIFTVKGKRKRDVPDMKNGEAPSIIPDDEIICAVQYVLLTMKSVNGQWGRAEDLFALDGFDAYDERVQKIREEGWEFVNELHASWERGRNFQSARSLAARL